MEEYTFVAPARVDLEHLFLIKNEQAKENDAHEAAAAILESVFLSHTAVELGVLYVAQGVMAARLIQRANYRLAGKLTKECLLVAVAKAWRYTEDQAQSDAFLDILDRFPNDVAYVQLVDKTPDTLWVKVFKTLVARELNLQLRLALLKIFAFDPDAVRVAAAAVVGSGANFPLFVNHPEALELSEKYVRELSDMAELVEKLKLRLPLQFLCTSGVSGHDEVYFTWVQDDSPLGASKEMLYMVRREVILWLEENKRFNHVTFHLRLMSQRLGTEVYSCPIAGQST